MLFSIEPAICLPGRFGPRLEEIIIWRDEGPEFFSELPYDSTAALRYCKAVSSNFHLSAFPDGPYQNKKPGVQPAKHDVTTLRPWTDILPDIRIAFSNNGSREHFAVSEYANAR